LIERDEVFVLFNESVEKHLTNIHWKRWCKLLWSKRDVCKCEISFSYGEEYEDDCLLGCCAVYHQHFTRKSLREGVGSGAVRGESVLVGGLKGCYWWKTV
jgi:hypothetical protein